MFIIIGLLLMLQADRAQVNGLSMNELDFEFLTKGDPAVDAKDTAGRMQQNLTPEEINEMAKLAPYAQKFMLLLHKAETGEIPSVEQANQMISQIGPEIGEQGVPESGLGETRVPQDMQSEAMVPSRPVEGQVAQNAPEMMAEGGYARSGSTYSTLMDQAKAIVREKHPRQARYLDVLNIVMKPDMEGHSEYRSGDYDDSKEYGYKHTIEINPRYSKTPEEIASTIAGETLHHMRDKDPEFRQMWSGLRETLGQNPEFRKFQEKRQGTMKDTRDLDHFIDASALDEWIRAYQFKDDPIAGKHYEKNWKTDEFHKDKKYQPQFENIRQYLGKGMATGGVAAGPVGVVDQPSADNSGVADDVPAESDGYVINAAAVRKIGLRKINDMIQKAIKYAQEQGMQLDFGKTPTNAEEILVSNGEVVIPDVLARIIGYDELEKINALGAEETDEVIEEQGEKPVQEMPVALRKGGSSWKAYLDKYQGPFPDEDAQIRQTILDKMEPYEDSELEDLELYKKNYEDYWNPETALKQRGSNRRYLDEERTERGPEWGGYLDKAYTDFEASDEVKEAVRRVLPAFKYELDKHGMYDAKQFDYWSQIESKGGKDRISDDKNDYGTFQVNMPLLKKIFKSDELFENFTKYYGPKATAATGISPYFLRKLYLEDKESFKDLMVDDHATNLAVGLAGSLLPAVD